MADAFQPVGRFRVAAEHPCLPGHFPGRPVVPGAVLLDEAVALLETHAGRAVVAVPAAKFVAVVGPAQEVEVCCGSVTAGGRLDFECRVAGETVARGALRLADLA